MNELLTVEQMYKADRYAMARGMPGLVLMENAGRAVADVIRETCERTPTAVLCGPGNNGGDGFVVARLLRDAGWSVSVHLLGERNGLSGDAGDMARRWNGPIHGLTETSGDGAGLIVDAIFGAGLARDVTGEIAKLIARVTQAGTPVVAIDVPTGISGDTGQIAGTAFRAARTVTFFRAKPGHWLLPGRIHCGELTVAGIGIPDEALGQFPELVRINEPSLWQARFPSPSLDDHKYKRGHTVIVSGGPTTTGAARLAARAALRIGSGLVTVASPTEALMVHAAQLTTIMLREVGDADALAGMLEDKRLNAVLIGPGCGVDSRTRNMVLAALLSGAAVTLDADALTSFEGMVRDLFVAIQGYFAGPVVLTPHEGEFKRIFPDLDGSKLERARAAARASGAVILLKGADTVIADPKGRCVINNNAGPELATAGSGDVLAGIITGLMAQGMDPFDAACAAAWVHGEAGAAVGRGLIAEDLPEELPPVLHGLELQRSTGID